MKQADNARSKKFDTVTSDHDRSGNCHVYDWLLSILNVLNFEQNIEMSNSQLIIKFFAHKQTLNNTFASAIQLMHEFVCRTNLFGNEIW